MQKGLRILITGASRGIGYAIAKKVCLIAEKLLLTSKYPETIAKAVREFRCNYIMCW